MERDMSKWIDRTKPAPWFTEMTVEQRQEYGRAKFMDMSSDKAVSDFHAKAMNKKGQTK